jgi:hypothetical protein
MSGRRGWRPLIVNQRAEVGALVQGTPEADNGAHPVTDDSDATAAPAPDDYVAQLQAEIDAVKARRAGYRAEAAETVARGGPARPTNEELGIVTTDDTIGKIAADASQEIGSGLRQLTSRLRRGRKS